jgi:site-specific recombinase XerD
VCRPASVSALSLHSFRRAFALSMLRSGADMVSLSRLMGHGGFPILQHDLKQLKADLGDVHSQHSPVDNAPSTRRTP